MAGVHLGRGEADTAKGAHLTLGPVDGGEATLAEHIADLEQRVDVLDADDARGEAGRELLAEDYRSNPGGGSSRSDKTPRQGDASGAAPPPALILTIGVLPPGAAASLCLPGGPYARRCCTWEQGFGSPGVAKCPLQQKCGSLYVGERCPELCPGTPRQGAEGLAACSCCKHFLSPDRDVNDLIGVVTIPSPPQSQADYTFDHRLFHLVGFPFIDPGHMGPRRKAALLAAALLVLLPISCPASSSAPATPRSPPAPSPGQQRPPQRLGGTGRGGGASPKLTTWEGRLAEVPCSPRPCLCPTRLPHPALVVVPHI